MNKTTKYIVILAFTFAMPQLSFAQQKPRASNLRFTEEPKLPVVQLDFNYALHQPFGKLQERYGLFNGIGAGASYRWENGFITGFNFSVLWGARVRERHVLDSITGSIGSLIDNHGNPAVVDYLIAGYHGDAYIGYLIRTQKKNPNSGIILRAGAGFVQHKIKFKFVQDIMPQLEDDMFKGYDRLTNGFMTTQFIGYQYSSVLRRIHFWGGLELTTGFTQNRRGYNYDTRQFDNAVRIDNLATLKAGFMIPIFQYGKGEKEGGEIYFN